MHALDIFKFYLKKLYYFLRFNEIAKNYSLGKIVFFGKLKKQNM